MFNNCFHDSCNGRDSYDNGRRGYDNGGYDNGKGCDNGRGYDNGGYDNGRNNRCDLEFHTKGKGILFGIAIGDRVVLTVKDFDCKKELSVVFQGMVDHVALFTNGHSSGLLRVALKDIITVRVC